MVTGEVFRVGLPSGRSRLVQVTGPLDINGGITGFRMLPELGTEALAPPDVARLVAGPAEAVLTTWASFDDPTFFDDTESLGTFEVPTPVEQVEALRGYWDGLVLLPGTRAVESWDEALREFPALRLDRAPMDVTQQRDALYAALEHGIDFETGLPVGFVMPDDDEPELLDEEPRSVESSGWGPDPAPWFDNDLAMDFIGDVQSAGSWEPVAHALEHPDEYDDREIVAACALVACALTESLGLDLGFDDLSGVLEAPPAALVAAAEVTVRRIRETEGTDLHLSIWEAPGLLYEPWLASLERMDRHLASAR